MKFLKQKILALLLLGISSPTAAAHIENVFKVKPEDVEHNVEEKYPNTVVETWPAIFSSASTATAFVGTIDLIDREERDK